MVDNRINADVTPLRLLTINDLPELGEAVQSAGKREALNDRVEDSRAKPVDVLVTETRKPVYLVLSGQQPVLWMLHLAEGAQIEAIAVIGGSAQAIANVPEGVEVRFVITQSSWQRSCAVSPARPVTPSWEMIEMQQRPAGSFWRKKLINYELAHREYHKWLVARVGEPDHVVTAEGTAHMLAGPKPAKRIAYRSLKGASVRFAPAAWPAWGDREHAAETLVQLVESTVD